MGGVAFMASLALGLEREAIAAQAPEVTVAGSGGFDSNQKLVGGMETAVRMAFSGMLVNRDAGACGFTDIQRCAIAAVNLYRRPFRQDGERRRAEVLKFLGAVNDLAADNCQDGFNSFDVVF